MPGIRNLGNTCYMSSAVQAINRIRSLRNAILQDVSPIVLKEVTYVDIENRVQESSKFGSAELKRKAELQWEREDREIVMQELKKLLQQLQEPEVDVLNPRGLRNVLKLIDQEFNNKQQHDSWEFFQKLFQLMYKFDEVPAENGRRLCDNSSFSFFEGCIVTKLVCCQCGFQREIEAHSALTTVDVGAEVRDLQQGLTEYFRRDEVDWQCRGTCRSQETATKTTMFRNPPKYLSFLMKKVVHLGGRSVKINNLIICNATVKLPKLSCVNAENVWYELVGVINHLNYNEVDYATSGHYTFMKIHKRKVTLYDDAAVSTLQVHSQEELSKNAYVAIYRYLEQDDTKILEEIAEAKNEKEEDTGTVGAQLHDSELRGVIRVHARPYDNDSVQEIFNNIVENPDSFSISISPPYNVKNGETFLYRLQRDKDTNFLRDGLNGFQHQGTNKMVEMLKRYYYLKVDGKVLAKKFVYCLKKDAMKKGSLVLIHYLGDDEHLVGRPHGNSKSGKIFASSVKEVGERLMEKSKQVADPTKIYNTDVKESRAKYGTQFEEMGKVDCARNTAQVKYYKRKDLQLHCINKDEIMAILDMAKCGSGKFIRDVHMHPNMHVIISEPYLTKYAKAILQESARNNNLKQIISFDTTFNLSDAYVSPLVMRNTFIIGEPIFSVAYLVHKNKTECTHEAFWKLMDKELDLASVCKVIPVITDKESAIRSAIRKVIPDVNLYMCHNHLFDQIKDWIGRHGGQSDDFGGILRQISVLLNEEEEARWDQLYEEYHRQWSIPFLEYFQKDQLEDVRKSSKFNFKRDSVFAGVIPTTNTSESENARLSKFTGGKEVRLDVLVLMLHQLQLQYLSEFDLAYGSMGNHFVKFQYRSSKKALVIPPYITLSQEQFADLLINELAQIRETEPPCYTIGSSTAILAAAIASAGLVSLDSVAKVFTVRSVDNKQVQSVRYDAKKGFYICNCGSRGMCVHIRAVLIAQGIEISDEKKGVLFQLNTLNKAIRKGKGKSGRKRPKVGDDDFSVIEAPDSILATSFLNAMEENENAEFDAEHEQISEDCRGRDQINTQLDASIDRQEPEDSNDEDAVPIITSTPKQVKRRREKEAKVNTVDRSDWLSTSEVEDGVCLVLSLAREKLKTSHSPIVVLSIMEAPELIGSMKVRNLLQQISQTGLLQADIVLQPLNTDTQGRGSHWVLGGIMWRQKLVFIMNSSRHSTNQSTRFSLFAALFFLVHAAAALGKMKTSISEWKAVDCTDTPQQTNSKDCGIFAILLSKSIAEGTPVRDAVSNINPRKWFETNFLNRKYRVRQINRRVLRSTEPAITACEQYIMAFLQDGGNNMPRVMETEIEPTLARERQFAGRECVKCDADQLCTARAPQQKINCVRCRKLFHLKCNATSNLGKPWPSSLFCGPCKPSYSSTFVDFNPAASDSQAIEDTLAEFLESEDSEGTNSTNSSTDSSNDGENGGNREDGEGTGSEDESEDDEAVSNDGSGES